MSVKITKLQPSTKVLKRLHLFLNFCKGERKTKAENKPCVLSFSRTLSSSIVSLFNDLYQKGFINLRSQSILLGVNHF